MVERNTPDSYRKQSGDKMDIEPNINRSNRITEELFADPEPTWLVFTQTPSEIFKSTFHISQSLYDEQQAASKAISSRKFYLKPICRSSLKSPENELFLSNAVHKGCMYQSFIPNTVRIEDFVGNNLKLCR